MALIWYASEIYRLTLGSKVDVAEVARLLDRRRVSDQTTADSEPADRPSLTAAQLRTEYSGRNPNFFSNVLAPAWMLVFGHDEVHERHRQLSFQDDKE